VVLRIEPKFFLVVGISDVITPFKFGDNRFRGFGMAEGQILPFSTDFEGRFYNTHTTVHVRCDTKVMVLLVHILLYYFFIIFMNVYLAYPFDNSINSKRLQSSRMFCVQ